jgi:signal transduction histidine kinase
VAHAPRDRCVVQVGRVSLKTKAALAFTLFALLCVGVTAVLLLQLEQVQLREALVERQQLLTENRALMVRDQLDTAMRELVRLSRMTEIDLDDGDPVPEQQVLAQAFRQTSFFTGSVQLFASDGTCRWGEPVGTSCVGENHGGQAWFQRVLGSGQPALRFVPEADGKGLVHLVVPIFHREGRVAGLLRGTMDLEADRPVSSAVRGELPEGTLFALLVGEREGLYLHPGWRRGQVPLEVAVSGLATQNPGAETVRWNGDDHLVAWAPVGRGPLGLAFAWPWHALDDTASRAMPQLLWLLVVFGVLALAAGYLLARGLTRPVLELAEQVRAVESGERSGLPEGAGSDEIGRLRTAFATLLHTLRDHEAELRRDRDRTTELAEELERRVVERTRQLEATQEALVRAERLAAVGRAGAVLSHELRNALNAISVGIDALTGNAGHNGALRRDVARSIRGEVARLRTLSDDLLDFARDPVLHRRRVPLRDLLARAIDLLDEDASAHDVFVELCLEAPPCEVVVDDDRMQTVLLNLLRNAIEAAASRPAPRTVRVHGVPDGSWVDITVEDSGPGIAPEVASRLFQPFVTSKHSGVGLGLAVASRFVRAHGGELTVGEGALGGAGFRIRLPIGAAEERAPHDPLRAAHR